MEYVALLLLFILLGLIGFAFFGLCVRAIYVTFKNRQDEVDIFAAIAVGLSAILNIILFWLAW
jgi:hypothetical protein